MRVGFRPLGRVTLIAVPRLAKPRPRLALRLGNFPRRHLERYLGPARLTPGVTGQSSKVEPFMGFDQVDHHAAAAGRIGHPKVVQRVDITEAIGNFSEPRTR